MSQKLLAVLIIICAAGTASAAVTVSFQQDVDGYTGTLDTFFNASDTFTPHGDLDFVSVDEDFSGGVPAQGALRFTDIRGSQPGQIPTSTVTIGFAELQIEQIDDSGGLIRFHRVLAASPWDEDSTWDSLGGSPFGERGDEFKPIVTNGVEALADPDFTVPNPAANEPKIFNVTAAVKSWIEAGAANLGWAANQNTTGGWDFASSEHVDPAFHPKLTVVYYLPGKLADINGDNNVNLTDYQLLLNNMGLHVTQSIFPGDSGDLNFDRKIDPADFGVFKTEFPGGVAALNAALAGVPEPSSAVLVVLSACGLALRKRRTGRLSA